MNTQDLVKHYGGYTQAAAVVGVTENTVRNWGRNNKIPRVHQLAYQLLTNGKLKAETHEK
jgi:DNA-binding transcriptional regulator YiaG